MKNQKGMTLIEVIVAMALISIVATVFFRTASTGYVNIVKTNDITKDSFSVQRDIENKIRELKGKSVDDIDSKTEVKTIFGKKVKGHIVNFDIKSDDSSKHGEYTAFIPNIKITYDLPTVDEVRLTTNSGDKINISMIDAKKLNTTLEFRGIHKNGEKENFLLNVYRWYVTPTVEPFPKNEAQFIEATKNLKTNTNDFIILKEWNAARKKQNYDFDDLSVIPNIEHDFNNFKFEELKFSGPNRENQIIEMFQGRAIIYSVTPYSTIGKMGEEVFSTPIYINPVTLPLK